jgi:isocitrate/isopropylmalate dehydrogenase
LIKTAREVEKAVQRQLASQNQMELTVDLGGSATTSEFTAALIGRLNSAA